MDKQIIRAAVHKAGGAVQVAKALGISSRVAIYDWIYKSRVPAERIIPLAKLTGWEFTPHTLDPNLYPNPTDGMPAQVQD